jgi:hypothetical protein
MPEYNMPIILRRICFGYWNNLAAVRAVDCDVPFVGLNGFVHQQDSSPEPKLSEHSDPLGDNENSEHRNDHDHHDALGHLGRYQPPFTDRLPPILPPNYLP